MLKYVHFLSALFFVTCIAACGGGSSTTAATQIYDTLPLTPAPAPANANMGGAVQGGSISAKFANYSVSTFSGVAKSAGFGNYSTINGPPALYNHPTDITTDGSNFYVADYGNSVIRKIDSTGKVTHLACTDAITGLPIGFYRPTGITISPDGTQLYVVDFGSNTIRFIDLSNNNKVTIIGSTTGLSGSVDVAVVPPATTADVTLVRFKEPIGITTDGENVYVTDYGNHTVRRIVVATKAVSTLAGASGSIGSSDGIQGAARFNRPGRITTDRTSLYLTDFGNRTIRKIDITTATVSTLAGSTGPLSTDDGTSDGTGGAAHFNQPNGITTNGTYIYVTDSYHNTIRRINKLTGEVKTISGISRTAGIGGAVDSPGTPSFYTPIGITTNGSSLFVADSYNSTIRRIH
ncbi:MAG: hypothetical protein PHI31_01790 [Desulfuromonadaceae bacterium]|nr:hypothetical protein [Desulfuromonadaceae bacterium]